MRHIFIVNPAAGKKNIVENIVPKIEKECKDADVDYEIYITKGFLDATQKVKHECAKGGAIRFYACGGDGTINEVANGMFGCENAELAAIPCGTGNDFIKNFGEKELFLNIGAQIRGLPHKIDLLKVNSKVCINLCSMGFDADVAANMKKFKRLPFVQGSIAYTLSIFYCFIKKIGNTFKMLIDDEKLIEGNFLLSAVCNGFCYGGDYKAAPQAMVDDGFLDIVTVKKVSRLKIASLISFYKAGTYAEHEQLKNVIDSYKARKINIIAQTPVAINIDGECEYLKEATIEIVPQSIVMSLPNAIYTADFVKHIKPEPDQAYAVL